MQPRACKLMLCTAVLFTPVTADELLPRDIAATARPAVVRITAMADGEAIGWGSGFIVSTDGKLVTNRHVIEGADQIRVELSSGEIYDRVYYISDDARRDLAILRVPSTNLDPLVIGDDRTAQVGDRVYVSGNPMGLVGTFSDGLISAKRMVGGVSLVQISAPISPGSSGGPVLNTTGEVIGVATLTLLEGQNLNMAVPARYANGLLAMNEEPQLFEEVAARFADSTVPTSTAGASAETNQLERWAQVLLDEMLRLDNLASDVGYFAIQDPVVEMIGEGESYSVDIELGEAGDSIIVAGVCDADCSNLDLGIYDSRGQAIVTDVLPNDRPELSFDVRQAGTIEVRVHMTKCQVEPCAFAVQPYKQMKDASIREKQSLWP